MCYEKGKYFENSNCLPSTYAQKLDLIIEKSNSFQLKVIVFVKLCYELI